MSQPTAVAESRRSPRPDQNPVPVTHPDQVLDAVPVATVVVDTAGRVAAASRPFRELLSLSDDPCGRPARFLSRHPGWQRAWKLVEQGASMPQVVTLEDHPDRRRYFELGVATFAGGTVLTLTDVTALRNLHQQLRSATKLLAAARSQVLAARDEMRRAEAQLAEVVGELEAATTAGSAPAD